MYPVYICENPSKVLYLCSTQQLLSLIVYMFCFFITRIYHQCPTIIKNM